MYDKLTLIDESTRQDHCYITPDDHCAYYGEYTARRGYSHSTTNQLVWDLKVAINKTNQLCYKRNSVAQIAKVLQQTISNPQDLVFVPVPPSKAKTDPLYDDRMTEILRLYQAAVPQVDYRELVVQNTTTRASHESGDRLSSDELAALYSIDESLSSNLRTSIIIFDDMLTTGSHFKAMQSVLSQRYPQQRFGGLFIARRVFGAEDPEIVFGGL